MLTMTIDRSIDLVFDAYGDSQDLPGVDRIGRRCTICVRRFTVNSGLVYWIVDAATGDAMSGAVAEAGLPALLKKWLEHRPLYDRP